MYEALETGFNAIVTSLTSLLTELIPAGFAFIGILVGIGLVLWFVRKVLGRKK